MGDIDQKKSEKTFNVCMDGWMDGWTDGDQKCPSIFLLFKYVKKQKVLILNMELKVVYNFFIRSYEHFKFQNSTSKLKIKRIF